MSTSVGVRLDGWLRGRPWVTDAVLAAALAVVLAPASLSLVWRSSSPVAVRVAASVAACGLHVALALRRRAPIAVYGAACLAMLVLLALPDVESTASDGRAQVVPPLLLPSSLVWPVTLHAVAADARRPWPAAALGVGVVGAVLATVRLTVPGSWATSTLGPEDGDWHLFVVVALLATVLAPWGLGRFHGVRAEYARDRARRDAGERARRAVAEERSRIAREMHDVVAHSLAVMVRLAEGGRYAGTKDPQVAVEALAVVADTGRQALGDMRAVMAALRDGGAPGDLGPQPTVDDVADLVDRVRGTGLAVRLLARGDPRPLDRVASLAAYRVVQESLTNAVKHAGRGAGVEVVTEWLDDEVVITVTDDGVGPVHGDATEPGAERAGGLGLLGMHERVALAGGRLSTGRRDDGTAGFAVRVRLPYRREKGDA